MNNVHPATSCLSEESSCAYCGEPRSSVYADLQDWLCGNDGRFTLVRCNRCGTLRLNPRPTRDVMPNFYPSGYQPFADVQPLGSSLVQIIRRFSLEWGLKRRLRVIEKYKSGGRLLEVGCATGQFLDVARRHGPWQVVGIEQSENAVRCARETLGLDVVNSSIEDTTLAGESYDVVAMWYVLEHLHDPVAAIGRLAHSLKPDGLLVIQVPHLESVGRAFWGRYWAGFDAPRHLYVFPYDVIMNVLRDVGLAPIHTECWGGYQMSTLSFQFWLRAHVASGMWTMLERTLRAILYGLPVRAFFYPWFLLTDRVLRRGSGLIIVARKEK